MAVFRIEKTNDYTIMSNHHFKNREMSLKAKGLLSLMLSLPEDWDYTMAGLALINKDGVDSIREALRELERFGYVERKRARNEEGHLKGTEYVIHEAPILEKPILEKPILEKPILENPTLENPTLEKPILENPILDNPTLEKPTLENPTQLNTNILNTNNINNLSNPIISHDFWEKQIKANIDYDFVIYANPIDKDLIDEIVSIMSDTLLSKTENVRIAGGEYPYSLVKKRFLSLDYSHIEYIIRCLRDNAGSNKIKNIKQYMKTVIFNAPLTISSYHTAWVNYDRVHDA